MADDSADENGRRSPARENFLGSHNRPRSEMRPKMPKMNFEDWMAAVDSKVEALTGLSVYDLPDYAFHDAWESGETAGRVARELLEEEGWSE